MCPPSSKKTSSTTKPDLGQNTQKDVDLASAMSLMRRLEAPRANNDAVCSSAPDHAQHFIRRSWPSVVLAVMEQLLPLDKAHTLAPSRDVRLFFLIIGEVRGRCLA